MTIERPQATLFDVAVRTLPYNIIESAAAYKLYKWRPPSFAAHRLGAIGLGIGLATGLATVTLPVNAIQRKLGLALKPYAELLELLNNYPSIVCLYGSIGEELIFRGCIQPMLARATGQIPSILGTSALFGLMHNVQSGKISAADFIFSTELFPAVQAANALTAGIFFGVMRAKFGLLSAMGAHAVWNTIAYAEYKLFPPE